MKIMRFQHGTGTSLDSCHQPYSTFVGVSIKEEGAAVANTFITESDAWRAYWAAFNKYAFEHAAEVIEWRVAPQIREVDGSGYAVFSRFSIISQAKGKGTEEPS